MLVARTDQDAPKHKGLTYFIMDMEQEAVQVRPLRQITGEAEFNELFIEEARIPDENVVGGVGNGWMVAITTLMHERAGLGFGSAVALKIALGELMDLVREKGLDDDDVIRQRIAPALHRVRGAAAHRVARAHAADEDRHPGPGGIARQVAVVGHEPGAHRARDRGARRRGADHRRATGPTASCAPAPTRSRAAPPRSSSNIVAERVLGHAAAPIGL